MKMILIAGFPVASIAFQAPQARLCNIRVRLTTRPGSLISIPMAPFPTVVHTDMAGGRSVWGLAGHPSPTGNGSWIPRLAGPGLVFSRGGGHPITTEDGSSIPLAAAGSILPRFFIDTRGIQSVQLCGFFLE